MLGAFAGLTDAELRDAFRWVLPAQFNIGVACSDSQPAASIAMIHVGQDDRATVVRYGGLAKDSNRVANALRAFGVRRGDRVCVSLPQGPELAIAHLATYKLGAIAVPMTTLFGPEAYRTRLKDSGASLMLTNTTGVDKVEPLKSDLPELGRIIDVGREWDALLHGSPEFRPELTALDDPALLIYTSGTTGDPKGALHGHRVLLGHMPGFDLSHDFYGRPDDRFWTPADWSWIGGLYDGLFPTLLHGSSIVSYASSGRFDPERAVRVMARYDVRNAFLPPTALKLMRMDWTPGGPWEIRLRTVMSGGEPLGAETLEWGRQAFGLTINEIFGQTEANYVVGNSSSLFPVVPGSMGKAYVGHEVAVVDSAGEPTTELGQIAVRSGDPVMFLGYWNNEAATKAKFTNGWMLTGDTGLLDDDGYFWFEGRDDDLINSAGYRIGPTEIEACIQRHPAVARAAVVGLPDPVRGQQVAAYVVLKQDIDKRPDLGLEIQNMVRQELAVYQYPRLIRFVDELPMTTTGKVRRNELRRIGEAEEIGRPDPTDVGSAVAQEISS